MGVRCSTYTQEPKEDRMVKDSNCVKKEGGIQHKSQRKLGEKKDFKNGVKKGWMYSCLISTACRFGGKD